MFNDSCLMNNFIFHLYNDLVLQRKMGKSRVVVSWVFFYVFDFCFNLQFCVPLRIAFVLNVLMLTTNDMYKIIICFIHLEIEGCYRSLGKEGKYTNHPTLYEDLNL